MSHINKLQQCYMFSWTACRQFRVDASTTILLGVSALHGCSSPMAAVVSYPALGNGIKKAVSPGKGAEDVSPRMKVTFLAPQLSEPTIIASCKVSIASVSIAWNGVSTMFPGSYVPRYLMFPGTDVPPILLL